MNQLRPAYAKAGFGGGGKASFPQSMQFAATNNLGGDLFAAGSGGYGGHGSYGGGGSGSDSCFSIGVYISMAKYFTVLVLIDFSI